MRSRLRLFYGITCICMAMIFCWNMGAMTSQPRFGVFCQQYMKDEFEINSHRRAVNNTTEPLPQEHVTTQRPICNCDNNHTRTSIKAKSLTATLFPPTYVKGRDINPDVDKFFTLKDFETKDSFINLHQYVFMLNTNVCFRKKLFLIVIVHSAPMNFRKRHLIRTTFGSLTSYKGRQLQVVFMLGAVTNQSLQLELRRESKMHDDIVQGNFVDSYRNLNRKHVMGMHWYRGNCKAEFILKLDDDTFINPFRLLEYMSFINHTDMVIHCKVIAREGPVRARKSKWYTSESQYPFPILPQFCLGFAYLTTPKAWMALYKASEERRLMDMDDLYVSVVLAMKAGVRKVNLNKLYSCPGHGRYISVEHLNNTPVFIDRRSRCGEKPFLLWDSVRKLNINDKL